MLFGLSSVFAPYWTYIKIAGVIAVIIAAFFAGVRWQTASCERALFERQEAEQAAIEKAREENELKLRWQETVRQEAEQRLAIANRNHEKESADAQRKIREFYSRYDGCRVSLERERLWRETNGESDQRVPDVDGAASGIVAATGGCTEADLHANHAALVARYNQMRTRFVELQTWARNALTVCNGKSSSTNE